MTGDWCTKMQKGRPSKFPVMRWLVKGIGGFRKPGARGGTKPERLFAEWVMAIVKYELA